MQPDYKNTTYTFFAVNLTLIFWNENACSVSSYVYCSNNPLNRIDPDGRDDIFNSAGVLKERTKTASNIYVNIGGEKRLLSEVTLSSQENRQTVANIIGHYLPDAGISVYAKGMIPIGDNPRGTAGLYEFGGSSPEKRPMAFASGGNIWINKDGGKIASLLDDVNNLGYLYTTLH